MVKLEIGNFSIIMNKYRNPSLHNLEYFITMVDGTMAPFPLAPPE